MAQDKEALYQERLKRYTTALRNGKPDRIPIRPFVAEFTAKYAGYTCQQVTHDYRLAFAAARKCALDFDWDAVVGNMVYVWTNSDTTSPPPRRPWIPPASSSTFGCPVFPPT